MEREGCRVEAHLDTQPVLDVLRDHSQRIDLLVSDFNMPLMDEIALADLPLPARLGSMLASLDRLVCCCGFCGKQQDDSRSMVSSQSPGTTAGTGNKNLSPPPLPRQGEKAWEGRIRHTTVEQLQLLPSCQPRCSIREARCRLNHPGIWAAGSDKGGAHMEGT